MQALLLSPVCPHVCEHIWKMIGEVTVYFTHHKKMCIYSCTMIYPQDGYIVQAKWPSLLGDGVVNEFAIEEIQYLVKVTHEFRVRLKKMISIKEKVMKHFYVVSCI